MEEELAKILKKARKPLNFEQICKKIGVETETEEQELSRLLEKKVNNYEVYKADNGNYKNMDKTSFRVGTYIAFRNGNGKVVTEYAEYTVDKEYANGAIDGDRVLIDTYVASGKNASKSSRVKEVIKRDINNFVGEIVRVGNTYYVKPDNRKLQNVQLLVDDGKEHIVGEKVYVSLNEMRSSDFYTVKINKSLGHKDSPGVDIATEAFKYGFIDEFPSEVLEQLETIPDSVREVDVLDRVDLRDNIIFTIDGDDTKDIDDSISIEKTEYGYLLGVHIADVSYYVKEDSPLDIEAKNRGTSAYLANKVIPMIPHKLSNGICSLNPGVDRLTLTCMMKYDNNGKFLASEVFESVIRSRIQMTYRNVNKILDEGVIPDGYEDYVDNLILMNELAKKIRKQREKKGSIDLNIPELKFLFDEDNKPIKLVKRVQGTGERLIEDYMISSNVSEAMMMKDNPFLYRVHGLPKDIKIEDFRRLLKIVGLNYNGEINTSNTSVQKLADYVNKQDVLAPMLNMQLLRCFAKAKYSPNNIGHYGLGEEHYSHTTSPIRRYPDLINQRIVKEILLGKLNNKKNIDKWKSKLPALGELSSKREVDAAEAERQVFLMKSAEYMSNFIGKDFFGNVTSMDIDGLYLTLDNGIEVKARVRDMEGKYVLNDTTLSMLSVNDKEDYFMGDILRVKIKDANKDKKTIDVKIEEKINETKVTSKEENNNAKIMAKRNSNAYFNPKAKHIRSV